MFLHKYPRTQHVEGSRLQAGDRDLAAVRFDSIRGRPLVVEEKLDGANCAFSFDEKGRPWLQSRGHFLTGGSRESQFALFKQWVSTYSAAFFERLGSRYTVFGEWTYAKHTIFYDALPHFFHEFDVLDRQADEFLSTPRRRSLLAGLPIVSVPVLSAGTFERIDTLTQLVGPSLYKSASCNGVLAMHATAQGHDPQAVVKETDATDLAEGLYIKVEEQGRVVERLKWIRASFLQAVEASDSHWFDRPILSNRLAPGVDIFGGGS